MDIQSFLRLKSLFGQPMAQPGLDTSNPDPSANMPPPDNTQDDSTNQDLLNQYNPRHAITDQYTSALANMPARPEPSRLRQLGASIAGLGAGSSAQGIAGGQPIGFKFNPTMADQASDKFNYPDYDNKLSDWQNQVKALGLGATEEDRANVGQVKKLAGDADREIKQQAVDIKQQKIDFDWDKSQKIYDTKKRDAENLVAYHDKQLAIAKKKVEIEGENVANMKVYHQAEINSKNARIEAQKLADEHKLDELKMQHEKTNAELAFRREMANRQTNINQTFNEQGQVTGRQTITKPLPAQILTNPDTGEQHDTRGWSAYDIQQARARGWY